MQTHSQEADLTNKQLSKLVSMLVEESLGVETKQYVSDFARKKQVSIVFDSEKDDMRVYR